MKQSTFNTDNPVPGRSCKYHKKPIEEKCYGTDEGIRRIS